MIKYFENKSGMAAVEFALVAPIFFALMFSIFEAGWIMTKTALIDNATSQAAREVYTGAALSDATITQETLKQDICDRVFVIQNCIDNITLEVTTITDLSSIPSMGEVCRDSQSSMIKPAATFNPGTSSEISFVRVCITTNIISPFLGVGMSLPKNAQGRFEIVSLLAFANEPF